MCRRQFVYCPTAYTYMQIFNVCVCVWCASECVLCGVCVRLCVLERVCVREKERETERKSTFDCSPKTLRI